MNVSAIDDLRKSVLTRLEANLQASGDLHADTIFDDLAPRTFDAERRRRADAVDLYAVLWQLVHEGIIVPGNADHGLFSSGGNEAFRHFPFFEITPYGRDVLERLKEDTDPAVASEYLDKLRARAPSANESVVRYVGEAVSTFNHQEYLASAVLLGVAAEELLEQLYESIGAHLLDNSDYRSKLNTKRWASQRLQYARDRLRQHLPEFNRDFQSRVDQYLDMLAQILKLSRDDVGHARPLRIDREIASMNLVSFPVLAGIVNELMSHLAQPCKIAASNGRKA
jgi:hypothetical protein